MTHTKGKCYTNHMDCVYVCGTTMYVLSAPSNWSQNGKKKVSKPLPPKFTFSEIQARADGQYLLDLLLMACEKITWQQSSDTALTLAQPD